MSENAASESFLSIRPATEADRARLVSLINAAFSVETFLEGTRTDDERLTETMRTGCVLVAERDDQLLGCVNVEMRGQRGYLGMLAVDPAHQGARIAHQMVAFAEEHLRRLGCAAVDIVVLSLRSELLPIYRRFGYVETRVEEFEIGRTLRPDAVCHEIVLSKQLQ